MERLDLYDLRRLGTREYERIVDEGEIREVLGVRDADTWILLRADSHPDSRILSNDSFEDWKNIFLLVEEERRVIRFETRGDDFRTGRGNRRNLKVDGAPLLLVAFRFGELLQFL